MRLQAYLFKALSVCILFLGLLLSGSSVAKAAIEPYRQAMHGTIKKGDTLTVKDEKFRNPAYDWTKITNKSVTNVITFGLFRDTSLFMNKPFSADLDLKVEYWSAPNQQDPIVIQHVPLKISYDTASGAVFQAQSVYQFNNGYRVKITINDISSQELGSQLPPYFTLSNQVIIDRRYQADSAMAPHMVVSTGSVAAASKAPATNALMRTALVNGAQSDYQVNVSWGGEPAAQEFDLEWTYVDEKSANASLLANPVTNTSDVVLANLFRNNSTRVTLPGHNYTISLVNTDQYLLLRLRYVEYTNDGIRNEHPWQYQASQNDVMGAGIITLNNPVHQPTFNWQYAATYAEEGKKKEVVSYLDGTLRNRQSVTLNNSDNIAVVQEDVYDQFGRPLAKVLPAPVKEDQLRYYPAMNQNMANALYSYKDVYNGNGDCIPQPQAMNTLAGASRYYSPNNDFINDHPYNQYIPDAQGYPFAITAYEHDNTGRVALQGGVGPTLQPNTVNDLNKTTRYYYSKPFSWELDRIFGNDAGNASHYLRNMVMDANGQLSLSYQNMEGKTIATALAGEAPSNLSPLPSKPGGYQVNVQLLQPADFVYDPSTLTITGTSTYVPTMTGAANFNYNIEKLIQQYQQNNVHICSNCYYKLEITITDNCKNTLYSTGTTPVQIGNATPDCNAGGIFTGSFTTAFPTISEYFVTYKLSYDPDVITAFTENYVAQNTNLKTQFQFILAQLQQTDFSGCYSDCPTCIAVLGAKTDFIDTLTRKLASDNVDVTTNAAMINTWAGALYDTLRSNCLVLRQSCMASPCQKVEQLMEEDVSPGGQYAYFDANYQPLEKDINVIYNHWRDVFPVLDTSNATYKANLLTLDDDSTMMSPNDATFTLDSLVKYWNPDWAAQFVQYHPEQCGLNFCNENAAYIQWDQQVQQMYTTAADIPSIHAGLQYSYTQADWLVNVDPFFTSSTVGISLASQFRADLNNYSNYILNITDSRANLKGLSQYVDYQLYCSDTTAGPTTNIAAHSTALAAWNGCTPATSCRVPDLEWTMYTEIYFQLKDKYYRLARSAECSAMCNIGKAPALMPTGCLTTNAFTITTDTLTCSAGLRSVKVSANTTVDRATDVTIAYPPEYLGKTMVATASFLAGGSSVNICIDSTIDLRTLRIAGVACAPVPYKADTCNGVSGSLILSVRGLQINDTTFTDKPSGLSGLVYTYTLVPFNTTSANPQQIRYCSSGSMTRYNCFRVLKADGGELRYNNVWVVTCSALGSSNVVAGDSTASMEVSQFEEQSLSANATVVDCNYGSNFFTYNYTNDNCGSTTLWYVKYQPGTNPVPAGTVVTVTVNYKDYYQGTSSLSPHSISFNYPNQFTNNQSPYFPLTNMAHTQGSTDCHGGEIENITIACDGGSPGGGTPSGCSPLYANKISRLENDANDQTVSSNVDSLQTVTLGQLAGQVQASCEGMADGWMAALNEYIIAHSVSAATQANLRKQLIEVCEKGGDLQHPSGASTAPPLMTSSGGYSKFADVIQGVLGLSRFSMTANPWLIDAPYPYDQPAVAADQTIGSTTAGICDQLSKLQALCGNCSTASSLFPFLQNRFGDGMKLSLSQLTSLMKGCSNCKYLLDQTIKLPPFLVPGNQGCITAAEYTAGVSALQNQSLGWSDWDITNTHYETMLRNFLNQRWGFTLSAGDYADFAALIAANPGTAKMLCNKPVFATYDPNPYECTLDLIDNAVSAGSREYAVYIDSVKRDFRNSYIATCSAAKVNVKMQKEEQIYHYTLYYYDQAGNVMRTVPPEGVDILDGTRLAQVQTSRDQTTAGCTFQGPSSVTDVATALQQLNTSLSGSAQAIEMWLYNPDNTPSQIVTATGGNQYIMSTCLDGRYLHVDLYPMLQQGATELDLSPSSHIAVDMNAVLPLKPWTHVVLQGTNMASGTMSVYVNGISCPQVADAPVSSCRFEIDVLSSSLQVTQNLSMVKQLRFYNRTLTGTEIAANAQEPCMGINVNNFASLNASLQLWSRFNLPDPNSATTIAGGGTMETQNSQVYPVHRMSSSYAFNSMKQVTKLLTPDAGLSQFWYDVLGRSVASQNSQQASQGKVYSYTLYDPIGRIIEAGQKTGLTDFLPAPGFLTKISVDNFNTGGNNEQITNTFYDQAYAGSIALNGVQDNLRKRVSYSMYRDLPTTSNGQSVISFYSYDPLGNVKTLWNQLPGLGVRQIDYQFDLVSGKVNKVRYQPGKQDQFYYSYDYDAENRLIKAQSGVTSLVSDPWTLVGAKTDALYQYYLHGPLAREVIGDNAVQGLDYAYTLQGWLKGVNSNTVNGSTDIGGDGIAGTPTATIGRDAVGFSLNYFDTDFKPVGNVSALNLQYQHQSVDQGAQVLFNGNIGSSTLAFSNLSGGSPVGYGYHYDQLNRLLHMQQHLLSGAGTTWSAAQVTKAYEEAVSYDGNGNILTYNRNGSGVGGKTLDMDKLTYAYPRDDNGRLAVNKLRHVHDGVSASNYYGVDLQDQQDDNYLYDKIGNLVKDGTNGVDEIKWTVYGKIASIAKTDGSSLSYKYDPSGNRIYKEYHAHGDISRTWYARDAQGNTLSVYGNKNGETGVNWKEQDLYGNRRMGTWQPELLLADGVGATAWLKEGFTRYELNNHLGNVLATVTDQKIAIDNDHNGTIDYYLPAIASYSDYTPFGMQMVDRNGSTGSYRYGFNGKENDNDVGKGTGNQQDYGMRIYDPRMGRFLSLDPLSPKYPELTPYQFASNSPIENVDLDGAEKFNYNVLFDKSGNAYLKFVNKEDIIDHSYKIDWSTFTIRSVPEINERQEFVVRGTSTQYNYIMGRLVPYPNYHEETFSTLEKAKKYVARNNGMGWAFDLAHQALQSGINMTGESGLPAGPSLGTVINSTLKPQQNSIVEPEPAPTQMLAKSRKPGMSAMEWGNELHYDQLNGGAGVGLPTELQLKYPKTEFIFTPRGAKGADVEVVGGEDPWNYPGSTWKPGNKFGDFKTINDTKFKREINSGKLPANTQKLTYDPATGKLQ